MELMVAFFAGGCFWCMESDFEKIKGVKDVESGYIDGSEVNPTYDQVSAGKTGHTEAVKISYDPKEVTYAQLLESFWVNIDPTVKNRQFCDKGSQYRSGIYYQSDKEKDLALASLELVKENFPDTVIHTEIKKATVFYKAEDYHQDYYKRKPLPYKFYRYRCGRDSKLSKLWGSSKVFPGSVLERYKLSVSSSTNKSNSNSNSNSNTVSPVKDSDKNLDKN
ncbi:MAG: peptide-methionine (S)-S-oxide reductase MsrA [Proteobacteria bacterium]|nr:peptide-methionine (S)-S-oxide reductase MsrA [Pseudomonadota bacterium]